jgi:hypothetical protein
MLKLNGKTIEGKLIRKSFSITLISVCFVFAVVFFLRKQTDGLIQNFKIISVSDDGIFTMSPTGSQPVFRFVGNQDRTYIGYYNSLNEIQMLYYDSRSNKFSEPVTVWANWGYWHSSGIIGNDHANPSIIVLQNQTKIDENGKILVAAAEHFGRLEIKKSINPEDVSKWTTPISLIEKEATYARLIELNDGTIWAIVRLSRPNVNAVATFFVFLSNDSGESWTSPKLIVDTDDKEKPSSIYITTFYDAIRGYIHFMFNTVVYNDPVSGKHRYQNIYYARYDHTKNIWYNARGDLISNGMPLILNDADVVYETDNTPGGEDWTYLSDLKIDKYGSPFLLSINDCNLGDVSSWSRGDIRNIEILRHNWSRQHWVTEIVGVSARFNYVNMATFEYKNPDVVYAFPPNKHGYGELTRYSRNIIGKWTLAMITQNTVGVHHARPFAVIGGQGNSALKLLWSVIDEDYLGSPYTDWNSQICGLFIE